MYAQPTRLRSRAIEIKSGCDQGELSPRTRVRMLAVGGREMTGSSRSGPRDALAYGPACEFDPVAAAGFLQSDINLRLDSLG